MTGKFKRKRICLIYNYDEEWIGGAYYIQNLAIAFNALSDIEKPELLLLAENSEFGKFVEITRYPYIKLFSELLVPKYNILEKIFNRISRLLINRDVVVKTGYDYIFPAFSHNGEALFRHKLFWIPDFQEHYLPNLFSKEEIERRRQEHLSISGINAKLLLSSNSALSDYRKLYPGSKSRDYVVSFAVSHPEYQNLDVEVIKKRFNIKGEYFISSNQFWAHKNHLIIIKAVKLLRDQGLNPCVVFTGRQHDWRNPTYFPELVKFVDENGLTSNILFLGLIERPEQLQLMKNSIAIIQSSKFEGWSTVIEDAKAMNQFVIASDISVHREQINENCLFFDPENENILAEIMKELEKIRPVVIERDYNLNILKYAHDFLKVIRN